MFELRKYQAEASDIALDFLDRGKPGDRPIIIAPTGSGKSLVIASIAKKVGDGVLVIQPSKELLEQNYAKFEAVGGEACIYSASMNQKNVGPVTFATIGSINKFSDLFDHVKCIVIDECHLLPPQNDKFNKKGKLVKKASMFMNFINNLPGVKVMGLTATAFRLKKYNDPFTGEAYSQINLLMRERPHFFNSFIHITQIRELYDQGFLSPVKYIEMGWENGELKYNSTGAEYTDDSIDQAIKQQKVYEKIPGIIKQSLEKGRKHRIVYVKNVSDAIRLADQVKDSACVHAKTHPKERQKILEEFKAGKIKTVFNVGVLTVGFDFPALDTIIIARPTMSLSLYMQMIGRGIRLHPGKDDCAVVDMCGNIKRFSKLEDIIYTRDGDGKWILHDGTKQLSGVRLSSIM